MLKFLTAFLVLILPPMRMKNRLLNLLGHRISSNAKIGNNFILVNKIYLGNNARLGYFNYISGRRLVLQSRANIMHLNYIRGPISCFFGVASRLGKANKIVRAKKGTTFGAAIFYLGDNSTISSGHYFDCCRSIIFKKNVVLGGIGSDFWTHGFIHFQCGVKRLMTVGRILIDDGCYIASRCTVSPGVYLAPSIIVGAHSSVSKSLTKSGMYVSQGLRFIPIEEQDISDRYTVVNHQDLSEILKNKVIKKSEKNKSRIYNDRRLKELVND